MTHSWINFSVISRFCKLINSQVERGNLSQSVTENIKGVFIKQQYEQLKVTNTKEDVLIFNDYNTNVLFNEVATELSKIINYFKNCDLEIGFIEISTFDPEDITGNDYYYLHCGVSKNHLLQYLQQCEISISSQALNSHKRGHLLPSIGLFRESFFYAKHTGKICSLNESYELSTGKFALSEKIEDVIDIKKRTKRHTKNFLSAIIKDFLILDKGSTSNYYTSHALLIPILRPAGRAKDHFEILTGSDFEELRYRGGLIAPFFTSQKKNLNLHKLVLNQNIDLYYKGIMESAVSKLAVQKEASSSFGHEIKQVSGGLSGRWLLEPRSLFEIVNKELTDTEKIGKIEVWQPEIFKQIYIAPFRQFSQTVHSLITLWTGQYKANDLPFGFNHNNKYITLRELIQKTWAFAVDVMTISTQYNTSPEDIEGILKIKETCNNINFLCGNLEINLLTSDLENYKFNPSNKEELKSLMDLSRICCCIFSNALKHFDPTRPYQITVELKEDSLISLHLVNYSRASENVNPDNGSIEKMQARIDALPDCTPEQKEQLKELLTMISQSKKVVDSMLVKTTNTKIVLKELLNNIDGKLIKFGFVNDRKPDEHIVNLVIKPKMKRS